MQDSGVNTAGLTGRIHRHSQESLIAALTSRTWQYVELKSKTDE